MKSNVLVALVALLLLQAQSLPNAQAQPPVSGAKTHAAARPLASGQIILQGAWRAAPSTKDASSRSATLRYSLFDAQTGGRQVAGPIDKNQPVDDGLRVSQVLDFGPAAAAGAWLQVSQVDAAGRELALRPRLPLDASLQVQRIAAAGHAMDAALVMPALSMDRMPAEVAVDQAPSGTDATDGLAGAGGYGELLNISTRGYVGTGDAVMIAGFIVDEPSVVMIRALGPSLAASGVPGVLADPTIEVFRQGRSVAFNDDFADSALSVTVATAINLLPHDQREAVMVEVVDRGAYTAIIRGLGGAKGIGLVEVFQLGRLTQPQAQVTVSNETGAAACYEILGSGVGEKCFGPGVASYGVIAAGRYAYEIAAVCGTVSGTQQFDAGHWEHRVWCGPAALGSGEVPGSSLEARPD